jgi:hypothetical protein
MVFSEAISKILYMKKWRLITRGKNDFVAPVPEVVEELCSGIRILNNVQKLVLIVLQDPGAPVVVPQYIHFYGSV